MATGSQAAKKERLQQAGYKTGASAVPGRPRCERCTHAELSQALIGKTKNDRHCRLLDAPVKTHGCCSRYVSTFAAAAQPARPVRLELNNAGSWKVLASFDAGDEEKAEKARTAGRLLGELGGPRTSLRICTAEALPIVLVRWTPTKGWTDVARDRQWER